jgi:hypothetical protein
MIASPALAAESKALVQLTFEPEPGKPSVDVWLTRGVDDDGGLTIKVIARGVGPRPQALTIYSGGGGDEGPGASDARSINAKVFELPAGRKAVRVDFTFQVPESRTREVQTDTWIVGFAGKTHKLLPEPLRTRFSSDRSKVCREREETTLTAEADAQGVVLVAARTENVDAVYGEDDLPVDKSCRAQPGVDKKAYRLAVGEDKPGATNDSAAAPTPAPTAPATNPAAPTGNAANAPAKETPAKDSPAKDQPAKNQPAKDQPAKDQPGKDSPGRDTPARDANKPAAPTAPKAPNAQKPAEAPKAPPATEDNDD